MNFNMVLFSMIVGCACSDQEDSVKKDIIDRNSEWLASINNQSCTVWEDFFTMQSYILPPRFPLATGQDFKDIVDELTAVFDTIQGKCDFENADVLVHGDLALTAMKCEYTHMNGTLTSLPPVASVLLWTKEDDWKIIFDIWNDFY